jgi:hypothetical protein
VRSNTQRNIEKRKRKIDKKLKKRNWEDQPHPMLRGSNIHYDIDGRHSGISCGGIGIIHQMIQRMGLPAEINSKLELLKRHLPYHESDHILNIAYNILSGGTCLEDIELRRNDEAYLNALGAQVIPDPTTAGDFLRRFDQKDIILLMDIVNDIRKHIWLKQSPKFRKEAILNVDGTISPTTGECKEGMDISYNGQWGYHPLVLSLAGTREPLYIVNRPGNVPSHTDSALWIDKGLDLVSDVFNKVFMRGDTDFSLTGNFDRWSERSIFVFGMDARENLVKIANSISESLWELFEREKKYTVKTKERKRPENVKDQVVKKRKFKKIQTESEYLAEFSYQPVKCEKTYRMIVLKKNLEVIKGEVPLFDDVRYFFYITNDEISSPREIVEFYRDRADHENDIEQLKNGARAIQAPSDNLTSNWAYMVIASLAWNLKTWYGLLIPYRPLGKAIVRMEFKRFVNTFINIPCLIVKTGRKICYRFIGYNKKLKSMLKFSEMLKNFAFT